MQSIIESATIITSKPLTIKIAGIDVNLVGTRQQYKQSLLDDCARMLKKKKADLVYLNGLLDKHESKSDKEVEEMIGRTTSIQKALIRISNEIDNILESALVDKQSLVTPRNYKGSFHSVYSLPIGKKCVEQPKQVIQSNTDILNTIVQNDMESFEKKMYEVLTSGKSETVVPVLKAISETFGYRLTKIPTKK